MSSISRKAQTAEVDLDKALGLDDSQADVKPDKRKSGGLAKTNPSVIQSNPDSEGSAPSVSPQTSSKADTTTIHASYASKVAEPLNEVAAMNQRLREGFRGAAQHLLNEQQQIVDEFYEAVSQPLDKQVEVNHFLSQVPEELAAYFS